jgi:hypothetical protein
VLISHHPAHHRSPCHIIFANQSSAEYAVLMEVNRQERDALMEDAHSQKILDRDGKSLYVGQRAIETQDVRPDESPASLATHCRC